MSRYSIREREYDCNASCTYISKKACVGYRFCYKNIRLVIISQIISNVVLTYLHKIELEDLLHAKFCSGNRFDIFMEVLVIVKNVDYSCLRM